MKIKLSHYLGILVAVGVVLGNAALSFADELPNNLQVEVVSVGTEEQPGNQDSQAITDSAAPDSSIQTDTQIVLPAPDSAKQQIEFINKLQNELNLSKAEYHNVLNSAAEAQNRLDLALKQKTSLTEQLQVLDASVTITTKKLIDTVRQTIQAENEISLIYEQIQVKEIAAEAQKNALKDYLRILYEQEKSFLGTDEDGQVQAFKLLLADDSVGNNLKELKYFSMLSEAGQQMVDRLDTLNQELLAYRERVKSDRIYLQQLQSQLSTEKLNLDQQKQSKDNLLKVTSGQEEIYKQLLEQSIKEQQEVLQDVKNLDDTYTEIQQKLAENGGSFDPKDYASILDNRTIALYNFELANRNAPTGNFMWPVEPKNGLSATFRDAAYKATFGMEHNAIDIPQLQGTLIRATADGVVYKTKDNGYGYSYVMLAHAGGYMSLYGHISSILVKEGDTIKQGSIIGLSGGMPGTKGAGYMTTGPHLHFELLRNGSYVDPLFSLPMGALSFDSIKNLPQKYQDGWKNDLSVSRVAPVERDSKYEKVELGQ
jgi:murein DD-endopeptidase MepM/ murein hydrolase activator NlpD